jgi:hypothetical protein
VFLTDANEWIRTQKYELAFQKIFKIFKKKFKKALKKFKKSKKKFKKLDIQKSLKKLDWGWG